jgi:hypothetical protein
MLGLDVDHVATSLQGWHGIQIEDRRRSQQSRSQSRRYGSERYGVLDASVFAALPAGIARRIVDAVVETGSKGQGEGGDGRNDMSIG